MMRDFGGVYKFYEIEEVMNGQNRDHSFENLR